jgi:hypothetical protein
MASTRRIGPVAVILTWFITAAVVTAPLWLTLGLPGIGLSIIGPFGIQLYKPGDQPAAKFLVAIVLLVPTLIGLAVVSRRWSRLGTVGRILSVVTLSILWHGTTAGLWWLIVTGLN